jgi:hypothetical protein
MRNLQSFINSCISLAMYNATFDLAVPVIFLTCIPVHLRILVQGDGVASLIDTCRVKDPDRALIPQFLTVHDLYPTYKYRTKKMY